MYRLIIEDDDGHQSVVPVSRDEITIGRREGNTIRLKEQNVSRLHARLVRDGEALFLEDACARYGVKVNGHRIQERMLLREGDDVLIGSYHLSVQRAEHPVLLQRGGMPAPAAVGDSLDDLARSETVPDPGGLALRLPPPGGADPRGEISDMVSRLVLLSDGAPTAAVLLRSKRNQLGRTTDNDAVIVHPTVRRRHAVVVQERQRCFVQAVERAGRLLVNGKPVRRVRLRDGDLLQLGDAQLRFEILQRATPMAPSRDPAAEEVTAEQIPAAREARFPKVGALLLAAAGLLALALVLLLIPWRRPANELSAPEDAAGPAPAASPAPPSATQPLTPGPSGPASPEPPTAAPGPDKPPPAPASTKDQVDDVLRRARQALDAREWELALQILERALQAEVGSPELERLFVQARSEQRAAEQLAVAREFESMHDAEAALLAARKVPATSVYAKEATRLAQRAQRLLVAQHLERGRTALKAEDFRGALDEYEAALSLDPTNKRGRDGQKIALAGLGRAEELGAQAVARTSGQRRPGRKPRRRRRKPEPTDASAARPEKPTSPSPPAAAPPSEQPSSSTAATEPPTTTETAAGGAPEAMPPQAAPKPPTKERALTRREEAQALYKLGRKLQAKGKLAEATRLLVQAVKLAPSYADPHLALGLIYSRQHRNAAARKELRRFIILSPQDRRRPAVESIMKKLDSP